MTAFALVTGALARAPETKTSKAGKPYVMGSIKVAADNTVDYWSVLVFSESAQAELMRLGEGDKVSVQGTFKADTYVARDGATKINRTIFGDHVLALRQPPRERKPKASVAPASDDAPPNRGTRRATVSGVEAADRDWPKSSASEARPSLLDGAEIDDAIPF